MSGLADLTLVEAADRVATGEVTSLDLLRACWANLDAVNPQVNAIIWQEREAAETARQSRRPGRSQPAKTWSAARRADGAQGYVLPGKASSARAGPRCAAISAPPSPPPSSPAWRLPAPTLSLA